MITLDEVKQSKSWQRFEQEDPFNDNYVEGYIDQGDHNDLYGALFIEKVDGRKSPQLIYCVPKLSYPFDMHGNWHFPKAVEIQRYTKLDGTSVLQYRYVDSKGNSYVSYKTRLKPFLGDSRFGPFLSMWREILKGDLDISRYPIWWDSNVAYEMWGSRNKHEIIYDTPLAASVLFLRQGNKILPPKTLLDGFSINISSHFLGKITAPYLGNIDKDYVWSYQEAEKRLTDQMRETPDGLIGQEGEVWYIKPEGIDNWIMMKCKSEQIKDIHFSSNNINKYSIIATCMNAFENFDQPTIDDVKLLLLEEFTEQQVESIHYKIEQYLRETLDKHLFNERVLKEYKELGVSILTDKTAVMRALSSKFDRGQMSRVYTAIADHEIR